MREEQRWQLRRTEEAELGVYGAQVAVLVELHPRDVTTCACNAVLYCSGAQSTNSSERWNTVAERKFIHLLQARGALGSGY